MVEVCDIAGLDLDAGQQFRARCQAEAPALIQIGGCQGAKPTPDFLQGSLGRLDEGRPHLETPRGGHVGLEKRRRYQHRDGEDPKRREGLDQGEAKNAISVWSSV